MDRHDLPKQQIENCWGEAANAHKANLGSSICICHGMKLNFELQEF